MGCLVCLRAAGSQLSCDVHCRGLLPPGFCCLQHPEMQDESGQRQGKRCARALAAKKEARILSTLDQKRVPHFGFRAARGLLSSFWPGLPPPCGPFSFPSC